MVMSHVELRTISGDTTGVEVAAAYPTVADVIAALKAPPHNYQAGVALMFGGKVLEGGRYINDFPMGHVIIAGHKAPKQTQPSYSTSAYSQQGQGATRGGKPASQPQPAVNTINFYVHPRGDTISLDLPEDCTIEQVKLTIAALHPDLQGCRLVWGGRTLTTGNAQLSDYNIRHGSTIQLVEQPKSSASSTATPQQHQPQSRRAQASGQPASPQAAPQYSAPPQTQQQQSPPPPGSPATDPMMRKLQDIRVDFDRLMDGLRGKSELVEYDRKLFYENSMKLLFRLDALDGLPQDARQERRSMVAEIQSMQDKFGQGQ